MSYYTNLIQDFGLTDEQLEHKYDHDGDGEHPQLTRSIWQFVVANGDTISGYWDWRGGRWAWVGGHWESRPHRKTHWEPAHWEHRGGGWVYYEGYWR